MKPDQKLTDNDFNVKNDRPNIASCIPVSDRESTLNRMLESLLKNSYEKNKITLLFYDGSIDGSSQIIKNFIKKNGSEYHKVIHEKESSPSKGNIAKARNGCFKLAINTNSKYIFSIDSDVEIPLNAIQELVQLIEQDQEIGIASIPYIYLNDDPKSPSSLLVDITLGCTIISRNLLDRINWHIDERFGKADDLWLGSQAEKLGFKVVKHETEKARHLRDFNYKEHLKHRLTQVPNYHYLLLREGLLTKRLKRTYVYYALYLITLASLSIDLLFAIMFIPLITIGLWHHHSPKKFIRSLCTGMIMIFGFINIIIRNASRKIIRNSTHF
ncbi:glycosyltransferase [Thermoproteota archaeon]